ncbi:MULTISPECIES: type II toxin-antitoxin system PemK/MazF family toxin [Pseudanabaena]|uniref:MazE/toxin transcriptional modulator MazF protein n=2 Tax=Pseudanabaena TaxID=1152 RepID=L8N294_9CYAN|nr:MULTISPECIES: type II toxin-antitoxin system PemK/MazF family toxin [Pseudanabaena]ELS32388.1 MazE/toxin transcriptional modulator MazF protein [Pseudanabaena biceps PCC 7429]MDG3495379.1 type II toxin-antitoxin system PemK/MazF family toxin [Pseudanabaena catenata USMAC16]
MPNYSKNIIILVRYPFSDLSNAKVRPAVIVNASHSSQDILIVPLTSKTGSLLDGEFVLSNWAAAGLNVVTAVMRGIYTVNRSLVIKIVGKLADVDIDRLDQSLRGWLGL